MLISLANYIGATFLNLVSSISNGAGYLTPSWLGQTLTDILGGANQLNALLPMYPHPNMTGIASETGIMPILAWFAIALFVLVVIKIAELIVRIILRVMPWNTQ